ncbi:MAG: 3'(2'),5'-bisphosphate nucleotidase CysQ [Alphaproteobacteria bacterium]
MRVAAAVMPGIESDHALLVAAVREAGALAMHSFGRDVETWEKRPGQPVCRADLDVNDVLAERLRDARPAYAWLSEEDDDDPARLDAERVWIVDPIDGTRAFLDHRPEFAVSVALAVNGAPVAAAVFNPATDELFDARAGSGARRNGAPVRASDASALAGARLVVSRTEMRRAGWHAGLGEMTITAISSTAYKLALVAAGQSDASATLWPKSEWDIAAGDLLVREAGGRIGDVAGAAFVYNRARPRFGSIVAAGARLYTPLRERLEALTSDT